MRKVIIAVCVTLAGSTASGKDARTYYDAALMARVAEKVRQHDWARRQVKAIRASGQWLVEMTDEELWAFVPPPEQIRAINVCIGHDCPTCGDEITRQAGHYPWIMRRDRPFKVECPVCKQVFPSNRFKPWNLGGLKGEPESGPGYHPTLSGLKPSFGHCLPLAQRTTASEPAALWREFRPVPSHISHGLMAHPPKAHSAAPTSRRMTIPR